MPEENYGFKPTEAVRSFGQIVGHVADSQYLFCSSVLGEKNPALKIEQTKTSKADLVAALKDAFAYCDKAYDGMTDASGIQTVKFFKERHAEARPVDRQHLHSVEHYGNLIAYLRMKNIVPPSSDPGFMRQGRRNSLFPSRRPAFSCLHGNDIVRHLDISRSHGRPLNEWK